MLGSGYADDDEGVSSSGTESYTVYSIRYCCPTCNHKWEEEWDAACDSDCLGCGETSIEALMYKDVDEEWSSAEDEEWHDR